MAELPEGFIIDETPKNLTEGFQLNSPKKTGAAPKEVGTLEDVLKSLTQGVVKGMIETGGLKEDTLFPGKPYKSQTGFGEIAGKGGEIAVSPYMWMGPGGLLAKVGAAGLSTLGSYFGGQVGGKPGEIIGGMLAPTVPGLAKGATAAPFRSSTPQAMERQANVERLRQQHGIEPRAGDVTGQNWLRRMERGGEHIGGGGSYARVAEAPIEQFTAELGQSFGQNTNRINPGVVNKAHEDLGNVFNATAKDIPIVITAKEADRFKQTGKLGKLGTDFQKIAQEMNTDRVSPEIFSKTMGLMDRILTAFETKIDGSAVMKGERYHELTAHKSPLRMAQREGGFSGHYANMVEEALVEALSRSARRSPIRTEALEKFNDARRMYANLLMVEKAVARQTGEMGSRGLIEPETMRQVLTSGEANQFRYARDQHDLGPLVRDSSAVISRYRPETTGMWERPTAMPAAMAGVAGMLATGNIPAAFGIGLGGSMAAGPLGRMVNAPSVQQFIKDAPPTDWRQLMFQAARGGIPQMAEGGIVDKPTLTVLGEAGPEAVVPLSDPAAAAQKAREIAALSMRRSVQPPGGRQESGATEALLDIGVPGRSALRSAREGDYGGAAIQAAASAAPFAGKALGAAVQAAPGFAKTAGASLAALTSLFTDSSTGRSNLSPEAQERLRFLQEKSKLEQQNRAAEAQRRKEEAENKARLEAESAQALAKTQAELQAHLAEIEAGKQREQLRIEQERQESERKAAEETVRANAAENKRLAERPFRERHPDAALNLTLGGIAVAALIPGASAAYRKWAFNQYAKEWGELDKIATYTLKHGTTEEQKVAISRLSAAAAKKAEQEGKLHKFPWLTQLGSAGAAVEGGLVPSEIDIMQPKGSEAHKAAAEFFTNPAEWGRLGALYGGGTLAGITAKEAAGAFLPTHGLPMGTEGTVKAARAQWKSESAKKGAQTRASKKPSNVRRLYEE